MEEVDAKIIAHAVALLQQGAVIGFPTDTVYALACCARKTRAVRKLYEIKRRSYDKPFAMLVRDRKMFLEFADTGVFLDDLLSTRDRVTYILRPKFDISISPLLAATGRVGLRIPDHPVARAILTAHAGPIAATSANISGMPSAATLLDVVDEVREQMAVCLDSAWPCSGVPSELVYCL